jgi:hypothetical protein
MNLHDIREPRQRLSITELFDRYFAEPGAWQPGTYLVHPSAFETQPGDTINANDIRFAYRTERWPHIQRLVEDIRRFSVGIRETYMIERRQVERVAYVVTRDEYRALMNYYPVAFGPLEQPVDMNLQDGTMRVYGVTVIPR